LNYSCHNLLTAFKSRGHTATGARGTRRSLHGHADFLDPDSRVHTYSIEQAQAAIAGNGHRVIVLMNCPEDADALLARLTGQGPQSQAKWDPRTYGIGAQILRDLGVRKMRLLSGAHKMPSMASTSR